MGTKHELGRLLVISCSAMKQEGTHQAVHLYDGPAYKILRKHLDRDTTVVIVSAEHGAIGVDAVIASYDRLMTQDRAVELVFTGKMRLLDDLLNFRKWRSIHVHCGKNYRTALPVSVLRGYGASFSSGGIGTQLGQLKAWLTDGAA